MNKLVAVIAALASLSAAPALAADAATISGSFGHTDNTSAVTSNGLAIGVASGVQANAGVTAGVAVSTPAPGGTLAATVSQHTDAGVSRTFTAGALGGSAAAANTGNNFGAAGSLAIAH
jgi:hypothetical protein